MRRSSDSFGLSAIVGFVVGILVSTLWGIPVAAALPGDADCNGVRDAADVSAVISAIMNGSSCPGADVNGDTRINAADLSAELVLLVGIAPTPGVTPTATTSPEQTPSQTVATNTPTTAATEPAPTATTATPGQETPTASSATPTPTEIASPSATSTISVPPTETPSPTQTALPTLSATITNTPTSTVTFTPAFTSTPTQAPTAANRGPSVVFFGLANANGCAACDDPAGQCVCSGTPAPTPATDPAGRQIFVRLPFTSYLIVVEGKPGSSGSAVGTNLLPTNDATRPDLQIESNRALGDGNPTVDCRSGLPTSQWGGIPGIDPPNFADTQLIIDALTDFGCRFQPAPIGSPCTLDGQGNPSLLNPNPGDPSVHQFCHLVAGSDLFPAGDTILTVQLRDVGQNVGPTAQIVVRIATPTPTP